MRLPPLISEARHFESPRRDRLESSRVLKLKPACGPLCSLHSYDSWQPLDFDVQNSLSQKRPDFQYYSPYSNLVLEMNVATKYTDAHTIWYKLQLWLFRVLGTALYSHRCTATTPMRLDIARKRSKLLVSELKDTPFSRSSIRCRWSWVCYRAYLLLGCFLILNILVMSRLLKAESDVEDKRKSEQALFASRLSSRKTAGLQVKATLSASKFASAKKSSSGQNSSINVPKVLKVYNLNIHPQQQRQWELVLFSAGMILTEKKEEAHVLIGNPEDRHACKDEGIPIVYGGSMYNGVPQRRAMVQKDMINPSQPGVDRIPDLARDGKFFSPWHFTNCRYWITKKESEVQMLNTYGAVYGLKSIAMPYVYNDVKIVDGEWNAQTQSEINGYISGLLERFLDDFIRSWKVKKTLEQQDIMVHLHGSHVYDMDPPVPHEDPEFSKSKCTLHLKVSEGTYWCNAVARSIAAGIPVITDLATYNIGLFDGMIQHNVSGVVLEDINEIIHFIKTIITSDHSE